MSCIDEDGPAPLAFHRDGLSLPAVAGAYVLLLDMARGLSVVLPGRAPVRLPSGRYLYCGSARGPGGIAARVRRHMRRDKPVRWHVDRLTTQGSVAGVWVVPDGDECALVRALSGLPVPVPGFGSSDCRDCDSHLLAWPAGQALPAAFRAGP
ncbi:MAG: GIY-YIG nuclease family protein [Telmatospirillum sp.]|nr:GIY-YIG nuclease family protein [Telmatospirillum sp.]